jgi:8-oxo-dGTP diphosphatase
MVRTSQAQTQPADQREFPQYPRVGVGGIVIDGDQVLLVRRGRPPLKGRWSIPGGLVEIGETLKAAVEREIEEETSLPVRSCGMLGVFERVIHAKGSRRRIRYHYVLIDFLCRPRSMRKGAPALRPQTDVTDARWVRKNELNKYRLPTATLHAIDDAFGAVDAGCVKPFDVLRGQHQGRGRPNQRGTRRR